MSWFLENLPRLKTHLWKEVCCCFSICFSLARWFSQQGASCEKKWEEFEGKPRQQEGSGRCSPPSSSLSLKRSSLSRAETKYCTDEPYYSIAVRCWENIPGLPSSVSLVFILEEFSFFPGPNIQQAGGTVWEIMEENLVSRWMK